MSTYSLKADSYVWNRETGRFEDADSLTDAPIFVSEKTQTELSLKELVPDEGSLLGIQQVIQQKLLDQAKEPAKIIDAVLAMERITFDSKFTYDPEKLTIELPKIRRERRKSPCLTARSPHSLILISWLLTNSTMPCQV